MDTQLPDSSSRPQNQQPDGQIRHPKAGSNTSATK